jgi:histidinol phosphatase-like PHP family hydrolase
MSSDFSKFMQECLEEHIDDLRLVIAKDEEHKRVTKEHGELYQKLNNILTGEEKKWLNDFDSRNTELSEIEDKFFYNQGFVDAVVMAITLYGMAKGEMTLWE